MGGSVMQFDHEKAGKVARTFFENVQKIADVFTQTFEKFAERMRPAIEQFTDAMQPVYRAMYAQYVAEGAIHGESHEGMMQWLDEKSKAAHAEAEAQRARDHVWMVEDMQRILAERNLEQARDKV